jgi:purine-binding chemotaxis protein CheW
MMFAGGHMTTATSKEEVKQLIRFTVGDEDYGIELSQVKEVIRTRRVTWLPKAPACVRGIINLRGEVIPIVDLRDRFGLKQAEQTAATRVIVVEVEERRVGIVVDSASQVARIPVDQFDDPPPVMGESTRKVITSVGRQGDTLVIMLDVNRILSAQEMRQIESHLHEVAHKHAVATA